MIKDNQVSKLSKQIFKVTNHCDFKTCYTYASYMIKELYKINDPNYVRQAGRHFKLLNSGIALVMSSCFKFIYFTDLKHPKLAILNSFGIYSYSEMDIILCINRVYPPFNIRYKNDVIRKIAFFIKQYHQSFNVMMDRQRNYIHVKNGFVNINNSHRPLIPFNPKYLSTHMIDTEYVNQRAFKHLASLRLVDCLNDDEQLSYRSSDHVLCHMTVSKFIDHFFNKLSGGNQHKSELLWRILLDAIEPYRNSHKLIILLDQADVYSRLFLNLLINIIGIHNLALLDLNSLGKKHCSHTSSLFNSNAVIADNSDHVHVRHDNLLMSILYGRPINSSKYSVVGGSCIIQSCEYIPKFDKSAQSIYSHLLVIPFANKRIHQLNISLTQCILGNKKIDEYVLYRIIHQPFI